MKRLGSVVAALLMALSLTQGAAAARDIEWCAEDPVFLVLGSQFRITTTIQAAAADVGGVSYVVSVPSDALDSAVAHYPQGRRLPTSVTFVSSGASAGDAATFPVTVTITVSGPAGADVSADLRGPSVTAASWPGTAGASFSKTFDVAR